MTTLLFLASHLLVPEASGWLLPRPAGVYRSEKRAAVALSHTPSSRVGLFQRRRVSMGAAQQGWGSLPESSEGCSYWWTETDEEVSLW